MDKTCKKYDIVIFDIDGTLLDTTEGLLASIQYTIVNQKLPILDRKTMLTFIGPPIQDSFHKVYGCEGEYLQKLVAVFRECYKEKELFKAVPYGGIYDVCDQLRAAGITIAVATYKRQDYAEKILKYFWLDKYIDMIYGADNDNKLKKPDIIGKCLENAYIKDNRRAVMIGDSSHDALGAEKLGIDFIGVTYGFDFKTEADVKKYQAVGYADTPLEILKYVI